MDFIKDNNPKLIKSAETILDGFPGYVKQADESLEDLDSSAFADVLSREFPINSKSNTFLSYAYFKSASIVNNEIESKIKKAGDKYGIQADLEEVESAFTAKSASEEEISKNFALSVNYGDEEGVRYYYPITDSFTLEKSARDLNDDFDHMPIEAFRHASLNIVKAASFMGVKEDKLPPRVLKTGWNGEVSVKAASIAAKQRKERLGEAAGEVYEEIVKSASIDVENAEDYVNLFVDMDRMNSVEYDKDMLNPYEAFYSGPSVDSVKKQANAYVLVSDAPVPIEEFTKLAQEKIEKNFTAEEAELLMQTVKAASDEGGISASEKLVQFPKETQKRLLGEIISE